MKIEDYGKYYIQGSDHYLMPKDEFKELFNEMVNWKEESKKQKEVIDKATNDLQQLIDDTKNKTVLSLGQFIPKLEIIQDELNGSNDILKEVSE